MILATFSTCMMYGVIVGSAQMQSAWYEYQLAQYDQNGDGSFSVEEQSPQQEEAMMRVTDDVGRNLTVFLGAPWAVIVSSIFFLIVGIMRYFQARS